MSQASTKEIRLCGLAAVRARFRQQPQSIKRLYCDYPSSRKIGIICKTLASQKKIYRVTTPEELQKIAGTPHHGGVVAIVSDTPLAAPTEKQIEMFAAKRSPLLILDNIGNPHNLGAIARSAAFFGINHIIIPEDAEAARPSDAAYRIAEGGLDHITLWCVRELPSFMEMLKKNRYLVIGAEVHSAARTPEKLQPIIREKQAPVALVLGNEEKGLRPEVSQACSTQVCIPGSGNVESLNVSAAAAVLIHSLLNPATKRKSCK